MIKNHHHNRLKKKNPANKRHFCAGTNNNKDETNLNIISNDSNIGTNNTYFEGNNDNLSMLANVSLLISDNPLQMLATVSTLISDSNNPSND